MPAPGGHHSWGQAGRGRREPPPRKEVPGLMEDSELLLLGSGELNDLRMLAALLGGNGYNVVTAPDATLLRDQFRQRQPDLVLLDSRLPGAHAGDVVRALKSDPETAKVPVLGIVPLLDAQAAQGLRQAGVDDLVSRPFDVEELLARVRTALKLREQLEETANLETLLFSVVSAFESREEAKKGHPERVARMTRRLGQRMNLPPADQEALYKGGILHDIGMIKVPKHVVDKPGPLTSEEYDLTKLHTLWGERMCRPVRSLQRVLPIIRHHHEQMDGKGYPDGLAGSQVPYLARILAVAEVFDALSSDRPYRPRMSQAEAVRYLKEYASRNWLDAEVVRNFLAMVDEEGWPEIPAVQHDLTVETLASRGGDPTQDPQA